MNIENKVWQILNDIEQAMQAMTLWQATPPELSAFNSVEPFFIDTMQPSEWLQWVFIPRMRELLEQNAPLPNRIAIAPYYEEALKSLDQDSVELISCLQRLDLLLNRESV